MIEKSKKTKEEWSIKFAIDKYLTYIEDNTRKEESLDGYSPRTAGTYKNHITHFNNWCIENDLINKHAWFFNEFELEQFLNDRADIQEWSGRTYNNYLEFPSVNIPPTA
ncbi:MAG: Site-specific recombinase XerD [Mucilaginibacter sp.]|nr:Site-specific recombinase XerD [Mucilaginibacter sp.]